MNDEIYQLIPHRPPFLFIDEIVAVSEEEAVATRLVRAEEPQFEGHYPGNPIMPGVLLCEAVFQTGAVYLVRKLKASESATEGLTPILSRISDARFKHMVKPGDKITITVTYKETLSKFHFLNGKITNASGKTILTIAFALALIEEKK